jgi:hypothetical protein
MTSNIAMLSCPRSLLLVALLAGCILPGCTATRNMLARRPHDPMAGAPCLQNIRNPPLDEVVSHLNRNTDRIQCWQANRVLVKYDKWSFNGMIAVEKGRHLRLIVTSLRGNEVDLGSNDERFWVWSREMDPPFVTCKHENMDAARHQMGIPFEPDWLMQALGVAPLPTSGVTMETDPTNEQARLEEKILSAHGLPLRRDILIDLKRGIVIEHSLYSYDGVRIARAKLTDHRLDKASGVVLPHKVVLDWPQNKLSLTLTLGDVRINSAAIASRLWEMPETSNSQVVHLDADVKPKTITTAIRPDSSENYDPIETIRSHDEHNFLRDHDDQSSSPDEEYELPIDVAPGRTRMSSEAEEWEN